MGRTSDAKAKLLEAAWELLWAGSYAGTSVDDICARADVRKGSFYHFFESKAELAKAALHDAWERHLAELDHLFSPKHAPLDRLRKLCAFVIAEQKERLALHGRVLGCPVHSLGSEVSAWEQELQAKIQEAVGKHQRYFESALREATADGSVPRKPEAATRARMIAAFMEGLLLQARILNDIAVLDDLPAGVMLIAKASA
jgi:TetR/AcrR family transcriptional regulator, transcriptional repressor for nem operon